MDEEALKKQFEELQIQQQEKLKKRKELKQKQKEAQALENEKTNSSAFGVDDDLDLKTEDPVPKSSSYLSEELVDHLNTQIRELKDENGRLFKLLSERDYDIRQLKRKREEDKIAFGDTGSLSSDVAASKIVELSKRVRELNAALETKKTEAKQLFGRCRHLENELSKVSDITTPHLNTVIPAEDVSPRSRAENESEMKQLADKLRQAEQRNAEYRNQVQGLKTEIKMAQKVISNEIGEGVNIHDLLNANSNWRGRAQQILALQKKVGEMKQQLEQQTMNTSRTSVDMEHDFMGASQSKGADMKHREALRKLEREKKEQLERSGAELKALEADYDALKQKMEASKARNKVLASENKSFRAEMQKLIDKGNHDDELISALIAQQANMKTMIEQMTAIQKENQQSQEQKMSAIAARNQQESNVIQQLKDIVSEKEVKVKQLEQELVQLKQTKIVESQRSSVGQLFDHSSPASTARHTEAARLDDSQQENVERANLSPSPPQTPNRDGATPVSHSRHGTVRAPSGGRRESATSRRPASRNKTPNEARPPSKKSTSRPSSAAMDPSNRDATADQMKELNAKCTEYRSLAQAAQVERDKLAELLALTQKRLDEANDQSLQYQSEMRVHKQNAVQLEKLVGKLRLESGAPTKAASGNQRRKDKTNMGSSISLRSSTADLKGMGDGSSDLSQLESALVLQKDENEALKAALNSTLQAKEEDLRIYNEILDQTKLVFLQGLRQFKLNSN